MRDDFLQRTKDLLAKQAGHRCAHPHCGKPTSGADESGTDSINNGVAAHITAASVGGPRYDPDLTGEQRKDASNGIWLCQDHAHAIDADEGGFSAETLRAWKRQAEIRSFHALMSGMSGDGPKKGFLLDPLDGIDIRGRFHLAVDEDLVALKAGLLAAAREDVAAFRRSRLWTENAIELKLRLKAESETTSFTARDLATTTDAFNELVILSSPGTGKTTTLLQLTDAIIDRRGAVASFIPLDGWSTQSRSLLESVVERHAFRRFRPDHLRLLAHTGELALVLDGWNQLDSGSRQRARNELEELRRDHPKLGIVISSRNLSVNVPFAATVVEIEPLDHAQQRSVANSMRGSEGETLLEEAWAITGLRELVSIPLFLDVILQLSPGSRLPTTKEGVLAAFVGQHDQIANRNETLRNATLGYEKEILTGLAAEAIRAANTSLPDNNARASVQTTQSDLANAGYIAAYSAPQPMAVLDALVAEHLLVRSAGNPPGYTFQHQQFQEWYASFAVEQAMKNMAAGNTAAAARLASDILNLRQWEESILFACERMAMGTDFDREAVARTIVRCLSIDPMLAAEMVFRTPTVWSLIEHEVSEFFQHWHEPGKVDRAIGFVTTSGRPEFAEVLWSLLSDTGHQNHLGALRAGHRFPPSLLPDIGSQLATLEESMRAEVLGEIAERGGIDGALTAASLAEEDPSLVVKKQVVESLYYFGSDQQAVRILQNGPAELWQELASRHSMQEFGNTAVTERMKLERAAAFERLQDPGQRLYFLLNGDVADIDIEHEVLLLLADPALQVRSNGVDHALHQAYERYPSVVAAALARRIEQGLELPFRAYLLVQEQQIVTDEEPIRSMVGDDDLDETVKRNAASMAGPISIGQLIEALLELDDLPPHDPLSARRDRADRRRHLRGLVLTSPYASLVAAVLARADTAEPGHISLFAELLASHRDQDRSVRPPASLNDADRTQLVGALLRWVTTMTGTQGSSRMQLAELARAIGSIGDPRLGEALDHLLSEELRRWSIARAAFAACGYRDQTSDARNSWTNWYQRSFIAIGTEEIESLLVRRLPDLEFGVDAAFALLQLWDQRHPTSTASTFSRTFLREMTLRRGRRPQLAPAPAALAILDSARSLMESEVESDQLHAIQLATAAFQMPCGDITDIVNKLLEIPAPVNLKRNLYIALALSGARLRSDIIHACIRSLFAESLEKPWMLGEDHGNFFGWVELFAFSDRPEAVIDAVLSLDPPYLKQPYQLRGLLSALGASDEPGIEDVLLRFTEAVPGLVLQYEWLAALRTRDTESSGHALLRLLREGAFDDPGHRETEALGTYFAQLAEMHPAFRAEMVALLDRVEPGATASVIERALLKIPDTESVLALVRFYARLGRSGDDLYSSIRGIVMDERPSKRFTGAVTLFPVPADDLRRQLFSLAFSDIRDAAVAQRCLTMIDEIRDDFGWPESELRHPDIQTGRPWPMLRKDG